MKKRLELIDTIRGLAIISMIGYHSCWIMNYFGILVSKELMSSNLFEFWQKSICITFITVSGFSFCLGRRQLRNGFVILAIGVLISVLSLIFLYDIRDVFGVLWLLGCCTLIMIPIDKVCGSILLHKRILTVAIMVITILLYIISRNINAGYINLLDGTIIELPDALYSNLIMTFLGFMMPTFYSVDYFSILPWCFLYFAGYCLYKITCGTYIEEKILIHGVPIISKIGRKSLIIYLVHPIIIYLICMVITLSR